MIEYTRDEILERFYDQNYVVIGIYIPIFLIALFANILVIWVVIKDQYMRNSLSWPHSNITSFETVTNYFLVNLSVADLMVALVCMPNAAYSAYTNIYYFGDYTCKITAYFQCVSVASSIFTITTMAIDRYMAINKPFGIFYRCFNKKSTIIVILAIWFLSFLLFLPIVFVTGTSKVFSRLTVINNRTFDFHTDIYNCIEKDWYQYYNLTGDSINIQQTLGITWFVFMFVIPGAIMLFAYSMMSRTLCSVVPPFDNTEAMSCTQQRNRLIRGRKRVACILLLLAFVFAVCWLPYHIINLLDDVDINSNKALKTNLLLLGHANSALNPIIYCALSRKFRRSIKDLICVGINFLRTKKNRHQWSDSSASGTQLHYSQRLRTVPTVQNQFNFTLTRLQSSQKTTKTCAV